MTSTNFYRSLEKVSSFFLLNFLWLIACLPLLTFFPATIALFRVVRHWREYNDYQVFFLFWSSLVDRFVMHFLIGLGWKLIIALIAFNYISIQTLPGWIQPFSYMLNTFVLFVFVALTTFLFPILAHYRLGVWLAIKLAFVLSHQQLKVTAICVVLVGAVVWLTMVIPISLLITGSALACTVYRLCRSTFLDDPGFPVQERAPG